jgi:hypothetical protein
MRTSNSLIVFAVLLLVSIAPVIGDAEHLDRLRQRLELLRSVASNVRTHNDMQLAREERRLHMLERSGAARQLGMHELQLAGESAYARPNVVMSVAVGLDSQHLNVFVESFRVHCSRNARLVLFVEPQNDVMFAVANRDLLKRSEHFVELVHFSQRDARGSLADMHVFNFRWFLFGAYLDTFAALDGIERVMYVDARDAAFQWDMFSAIDEGGKLAVHVFEEHELEIIRESRINREWLRKCTDDRQVRKSLDKVTVSAGVVGGGVDGMRLASKLMAHVLADSTGDLAGCIDQGAWISLVHTDAIDHLQAHKQSEGPVIHLWSEKRHRDVPLFNANGLVVTATGAVPAIVHQYDRIAAVQKHFFDLYPKQ